jgi:hypothetical protein
MGAIAFSYGTIDFLLTCLRADRKSLGFVRRYAKRQFIEDEEFNFNSAANIGKLNKKKESDTEEIEVLKEVSTIELQLPNTETLTHWSPRWTPSEKTW